jgi:hypothetical protein
MRARTAPALRRPVNDWLPHLELYSPGNCSVGIPVGTSDLEATLGQAGSYLLVLAGSNATLFNFSFRVTADDQIPVTPSGFNTPVSGTLQTGEVHTFTLTGTAGMAIYADSSTQPTPVSPGVESAERSAVFSPRGTASDPGSFILTESGTYTLTLTGVGNYNVRLLDLAAATDFTTGTWSAAPSTRVLRLTCTVSRASQAILLHVRGVDGLSTASFTLMTHDLSALGAARQQQLDPYLVALGGDIYRLRREVDTAGQLHRRGPGPDRGRRACSTQSSPPPSTRAAPPWRIP